ncbi:M14 family zinc carboxypeptidase [Prauserella halophila]|uniref:M14 family zinc carboxypeptidase n=1 Tax=Prauserella halophila TaxID=185641 RepID=A0ABN1W1X5_9PSEU|nr:M14 family zinc carboxypeptidase [Prauserella halophila]MCP2236510.1 Zinc carboxypeptidase [Prauserella halophila]
MAVSRSVRRGLAAFAVLVTLPALTTPAGAQEPTEHGASGAAAHRESGQLARSGATSAATRLAMPGENRQIGRQDGYPRQTSLREFPENPDDKAIKLGLTPYHDIAPQLNELQERSDRVSAEVVGQSTQGRDLYLVTLTAPESPAEASRQARWRELIEEDPAAAAGNERLAREYKAPVWINANIHGDEWEGTDGALDVIERLATGTDPAHAELLESTRLYLTVTNNPDGRVAGTRANAAGFDINRDHITSSQPESRAVRDVLIETQPLVMLDEHGYTGTTLIEPGTPPHGRDYEYDLYIKHAYENALGMERAIGKLGYDETVRADIPFRDFEPGEWDDWPPIFTPMYSIHHGTVGHTVEVPLRVNRSEYEELPVEELRRRSAINRDVVAATITSAVDYADSHRAELIDDQIETFRRGWAGEPQREIPDGYVPGLGEEDRYSVEFPRAYVIPAGDGQRSAPAAARLVDHLVAHDVRVTRAEHTFHLGGERYPKGSYVVDMHQPKRGLANVMLSAGQDISGNVPRMYDISGWSLGLLWGVTVDVSADEAPAVRTSPVVTAGTTGSLPPSPNADLELALTDGADVQAVTYLLERGVEVTRGDDGVLVVPASARREAATAADRFGVVFTRAGKDAAGTELAAPVIAAAVSAGELAVLRGLGFEVRPVSTAVLNDGFDFDGVSALLVSTGLDHDALTAEAKRRLRAFLDDGGVVTRGAGGAAFNEAAGLLPVTAVEGRPDANGVVSVTDGDGGLLDRAPAQSFVYSPVWFTGLGESVAAEQRYARDPLVAGHWLPGEDVGGPAEAAGEASVVSGVSAAGTRAVLFGTEPMFRDHPKGLYAQVADAVFWAAS